ncbi:MAG: succinyl-CoA--3-ketoacid-CoA transferase [Chloroflexi bacterium]|nr:succinyl-CoA--3-ketoacid-CoA transferase [Chloroflexota bacterium]|tara:strand:- start:498 stop:1196 length:699 start_codon:yes stop_codon:yes gene_type:complete
MKPIVTPEEAVKEIKDGSSIMIGGFGGSGDMPTNLILALSKTKTKNLTIISNTGGLPGFGLIQNQLPPINHDILIKNKQVSKIISSFPVSPSPSLKNALEDIYKEENIKIELIPQGTLAEKIRAGGAGIRAFYTPTGVNSFPSENKEIRLFNEHKYLLEEWLQADFSFIRAHKADTLGNLINKGTSKNFNPLMATASNVTIVEAEEIVKPDQLQPEQINTPGIFVNKLVRRD